MPQLPTDTIFCLKSGRSIGIAWVMTTDGSPIMHLDAVPISHEERLELDAYFKARFAEVNQLHLTPTVEVTLDLLQFEKQNLKRKRAGQQELTTQEIVEFALRNATRHDHVFTKTEIKWPA